MLADTEVTAGSGENGVPVKEGADLWLRAEPCGVCITITWSCVAGEGPEVTRGADFDAECCASAPRRGE